jgi:hypothetical protein
MRNEKGPVGTGAPHTKKVDSPKSSPARDFAVTPRDAVSLDDLLQPHPDVGLADPIPAMRLAYWHQLAREHISVDVCRSLWRLGFKALAMELMRLGGAA